MEDNLKKMKKMEDDLKKKWKTNQSTKINLIGFDTIVNSPSYVIIINCITLQKCMYSPMLCNNFVSEVWNNPKIGLISFRISLNFKLSILTYD